MVTVVVQQAETLHLVLVVRVAITLLAPVAALQIRSELVVAAVAVGQETILEKQAGPGLIYLTPLAVVVDLGVRLAMLMLDLLVYFTAQVAQAVLLTEV